MVGKVTVTELLWNFGFILLLQSLLLAALAAVSLLSFTLAGRRAFAPHFRSVRPAPPVFVKIEWVE